MAKRSVALGPGAGLGLRSQSVCRASYLLSDCCVHSGAETSPNMTVRMRISLEKPKATRCCRVIRCQSCVA